MIATVHDLAYATTHESELFFGDLCGTTHLQLIIHAVRKVVSYT